MRRVGRPNLQFSSKIATALYHINECFKPKMHDCGIGDISTPRIPRQNHLEMRRITIE